MLSSSLDAFLKLSKSSSPQKLFDYDSRHIYQGDGIERLLVKNAKKPNIIDEVDGDDFKYFLLAGHSVLSTF